eukprot:8034793-Ditylum_brightwellii.AAC.1
MSEEYDVTMNGKSIEFVNNEKSRQNGYVLNMQEFVYATVQKEAVILSYPNLQSLQGSVINHCSA